MISDSTATPVGALIDGRTIGSLQWRTFVLAAMSLFLDGYDTQSVAYIAPVISKSWALPTGAFGTVFAAALIGSAVGSFVLAPLADRVGRKRIMVWATVAIGCFTLLSAWAESLRVLELLRFLTGLGLGAAVPNALAHIAEYAPLRKRATIISITFCALAAGAALGAVAATALVPAYGWAAVFVAGGVATWALCPLLQALLPESLQYLVLHEPSGKEALTIVRQLSGRAEPEQVRRLAGLAGATRSAGSAGNPGIAATQDRRPAGVGLLFREGRTLVTVTYGLLAFLTLLTLYLLTSWLPTLIHDMGFSLRQASGWTAAFQLGGIVGTAGLGLLADRVDPIRLVVITYGVAAAVILCIAWVTDPTVIMLATFCAGLTVVGAMSCNNAVLVGLYPVEVRSTALGWNLTIGRVGSITGPLIAGMLLLTHVNARGVLIAAALPVACAAVLLQGATAAIRRLFVPPKSRFELAALGE
jgi:AAHS family 4-hydroxybenzoate transporter-like MFS transporter